MKKIKPKKLLKFYLNEALANAKKCPPRCGHFGDCGGCEYQDYEYAEQVNAKKQTWLKLLGEEKLPAPAIISSPNIYGYRQRMDYVFAFDVAGLRRRGSHRRVVELKMCPLLGERGFAAFQRAKELAITNNLLAYDYLRHTGFLRYFVVRQTRRGEILLSLVTKTTEHADEIAAIAQTLIAEKLAHSVYWLLQSGLSDLSFGEPQKFWGQEFISETYGGKTFNLSANTFAQANPAVAEIAYQKIIEANRGQKIVCDAYSGTGAIGQILSPFVEQIIAVENNADNIILARQNQIINNVENLTLIDDDAQKYLINLAENNDQPFSAIIVNPPRSGIGEKTAQALCKIGAPQITYLACNPQTLISDWQILRNVYEPISVDLFDMFPQTHHWETLLIMRKRERCTFNRIGASANAARLIASAQA